MGNETKDTEVPASPAPAAPVAPSAPAEAVEAGHAVIKLARPAGATENFLKLLVNGQSYTIGFNVATKVPLCVLSSLETAIEPVAITEVDAQGQKKTRVEHQPRFTFVRMK